MQISIESNLKKISKQLDHMQRKQLPFATSRALNKIAVVAQDSIIKSIPHIFKNSKVWWRKNQPTGIKVKFSNKYELVSAVYTRAYFARLQEDGGIKRSRSGKDLAVPASGVQKKFRRSDALRREQGNSRIFKSKSGKSILRRVGKKQVQKLYTLTPQAKVKARFGFNRMAYKVFTRQFDRIFSEQLNYALRSAK
ncbi:hypothetical protein N9N97_03130 [Rickettsiaceae bacterium]|nr:hypothetical protein [Rickettsiaceae bacterium]